MLKIIELLVFAYNNVKVKIAQLSKYETWKYVNNKRVLNLHFDLKLIIGDAISETPKSIENARTAVPSANNPIVWKKLDRFYE